MLNIQPCPPTWRSRSDRHFTVRGQVFPNDGAREIYSVQLLQEAAELGLTATDDLGEFSFETIPVGIYELVLSTDQLEIPIAPVGLDM